MRKRFPRLSDVLKRLSALDLRSIPVVEDGRLLGCVMFEDVLRVSRRLREMRVGEERVAFYNHPTIMASSE